MNTYSRYQLWFLVALRWLIGWHLMYEGLVKLINPSWTSKGYLASAEGFVQGFFHWMATSDVLVQIVDFMNMWGLFIIGLFLILGLLTNYASLFGAVLLLTYYLAHPPLFETSTLPVEGNYLLVNKTLIEACALVVLALFPTAHKVGIQKFLIKDQ